MPVQLEVADGRPGEGRTRRQQARPLGKQLWVGEDHLRSLGLEYLLANAAFILVCGIATPTRNLRFHMLFAFGAVIRETSFFTGYYAKLN
jgi:hypothetical protein